MRDFDRSPGILGVLMGFNWIEIDLEELKGIFRDFKGFLRDFDRSPGIL